MKVPTGKLSFAYCTIAALEVERDTLLAEVEQLNRIIRHLVLTYVADEAYDPEAKTTLTISRLKAEFPAT